MVVLRDGPQAHGFQKGNTSTLWTTLLKTHSPTHHEDPQTAEVMPTGKAEDTDLFGLVPIRSEIPPPLLTAFRRKQGWEGPRWGHCALHCFPVFSDL